MGVVEKRSMWCKYASAMELLGCSNKPWVIVTTAPLAKEHAIAKGGSFSTEGANDGLA